METVIVHYKDIMFNPEEDSLRKVKNDDDTFQGIKNSVAKDGLHNLFSVRKNPDQEGKYYVVDGGHRLQAIYELMAEGCPHHSFADGMISVQFKDIDGDTALAMQIGGNYHVRKTMSGQEISALHRLAQRKNLTLLEIAEFTSLSEQYVTNLLKLKFLPDEAKTLLDSGDLSITAAIQLNKLPKEHLETIGIENILQDACTKSAEQFTAQMSEYINEWKKSRNAEAKGKSEVFDPEPIMIPIKEFKTRYLQAQELVKMEDTEHNLGYALAWAEIFQMDEKSLAYREAEFERRKAEKDALKEKRRLEREAKKAEKVNKELEALQNTDAQ